GPCVLYRRGRSDAAQLQATTGTTTVAGIERLPRRPEQGATSSNVLRTSPVWLTVRAVSAGSCRDSCSSYVAAPVRANGRRRSTSRSTADLIHDPTVTPSRLARMRTQAMTAGENRIETGLLSCRLASRRCGGPAGRRFSELA